jgi:hypothetical protein
MLEQTSAALSMLSNLDAVTLNECEISSSQIETLAQHLSSAMGLVNETLSKSEPKTVVAPQVATPSQDTVISFPSPLKSEFEARA